MIKVIFNGSKKVYEVTFGVQGEHVCTLIGDKLPQSKKGFKTFRMSGEPLGDWSDYTTVYRVLEDGVQFSNDSSVWTEPPAPEPMPDPEPVDPQPTQLDRIEAQAMYTALMTNTLLEDEEAEA